MKTISEYTLELLTALDEMDLIEGEYNIRKRKVSQLLQVIKKLMTDENAKEDATSENKT